MITKSPGNRVEDFLPTAFAEKRPRRAATDGAVDDVDFFRIEKHAQILAPAAHRRIRAERGVTGDPEGGEIVRGGGFLGRIAVTDDGAILLRPSGKKGERGEAEEEEGFHLKKITAGLRMRPPHERVTVGSPQQCAWNDRRVH